MAKDSRNFSLILLIVFLVTGITVFIGCGGGGGSGDDPLPMAMITGQVTSQSVLTSIQSTGNSGIRAAVATSGIEVYIESNRSGHSTYTDGSGNFVLENVPAGLYNVVALIKTVSGKIYKVRSSQVSVSYSQGTTIIPNLNITQATNLVSGYIKDSSGVGIPNAQLSLWGETFQTDSTGAFTTPLMPTVSAEIKGAIPGYQPFDIPTSFNSPTGQTILQVVVPTAETNRPPSVGLSSTNYAVAPNEQISLSATASDPDGNTLTYTWSTTIGTIGNSNTAFNTWTAPNYATIATISCVVADTSNLRAAAYVAINVGNASQSTGTNYAPVISSIDTATTTFLNNESYSLTVVATDSNGDALSYSWQTTLGTITPTNQSVVSWLTPDVATTTDVIITVTVNDNKGGQDNRTATFTVLVNPNPAVNQIPVVSIASPINGTLHAPGQINYTGSATDSEDGALSATALTWLLSINGAARTIVGQQSSSISRLEMYPATYVVTLQAVDADGEAGETSVTFRINATPTASIGSPASGSIFQLGANINFTGSATDIEDVTVSSASLTWHFTASDTQTGANVNYAGLPAGQQTIQLYAQDTIGGISAAQSIGLYINTNPSITSISPASGSQTLEGDEIAFTLLASDTDSAILPSYVEWLDGATSLGTGNPLSVTTLTAGEHTIIASITDGMGGHISSTTVVIITNRPTMTIASPVSNQIIVVDQAMTFNGSGVSNSVAVASATMTWLDYNFNTNATTTLQNGVAQFPVTYTNANLGQHTIVLSGSDQFGVTSYTTQTIFVNASPTITIDSPASGTRFDSGSNITFNSTPTDQDPSDTLSVVWLDGASQISTANTFSTTLASGNHNIFCQVTDSHGITQTASISVLVNTLPTAQIVWSTVQYATASTNIPVFISANPSLPIDFSAVTYDAELNNTIGSYKEDNIKWYTEISGSESQIGTGTTMNNMVLAVGVSTITLRIYDTFHPEFEHQASTTHSISVYVWQSLSFNYGDHGLLNDARFISGSIGANPNLFISFHNAASPTVKQFTFDSTFGTLTQNTQYDVVATYAYTSIVAADMLNGKLTALGTNVGGLQIGSFTGNVSGAIGSLYNLGGALNTPTGLCSNGSFGYVSNAGNNSIIRINPSTRATDLSFTLASNDNYDSPRSIRYRDLSYGKIFVADHGNNRVVRLTDALEDFGTQIPVTGPDDISFSNSFLFVTNSTTSVLSIFEPNTQTEIIQFGSIGAGNGTFTTPARIFCSGSDLFILENTRLQVIRSGLSDWFK